MFLDKKEFTGSILKQLDEVLYFSSLSNRKRITISGIPERDEFLDIPKRALREAIVNCYCHRDYTLSGDVKIEFYDDKVQIFSPGSLPDGLTLENIKVGMVAKRNKIIVNTLDKIDVIENYASGVRRIFEDYTDFSKQPEYYISNNGVIVTLFNRNYEAQNEAQSLKLNNQKRIEKILELIKENKNITRSDLQDILRVSKSTIERDILKLKEEDKLEYIGSSKNGYWKIKNN
ncbi:ATP-binding protein [Mycoplasma zalophi]|uniref:ATP-binding protein n=1 Tax=Mycoplasma zalophi TaxID=191287 RepID=UPI00280BB464|nr:ATP-binding protein [Mycoplasma zalophi]